MTADIVTLAGPPWVGDILSANILYKEGDYLAFLSNDDCTLLYVGFRTNSVIVSTQSPSGVWHPLAQRDIRAAEASLTVVFGANTATVTVNAEVIYNGAVNVYRIWRVIGVGEWTNCKFSVVNAEYFSTKVTRSIENVVSNNVFSPDLIFDLGMHRGDDTAYYLAKGFRVIAIEANPHLCDAAARRFSDAIDAGRLTILNVGVGLQRGLLPFYINIDNTEWSSFDRSIAVREKSSRGRCEILSVQVHSISELFHCYGIPYYAKIDIEGFDGFVVKGISELIVKPKFVSYENGGINSFELLVSAGYDSFQMVNQLEVPKAAQPKIAREGRPIEWTFNPGASGLFGRDLPNAWCGVGQMRARLEAYQVERIRGLESGQPDWFDLHAALGGAL